MLKVYGSLLCKHCLACIEAFEEKNVEFEFHDFGKDLGALKEFLAIRDSDPQYDDVKQAGKIGIPTILQEDGTVTRDWKKFVSM